MATKELNDYENRVAMATTQFLSTLDTLRNLQRQGQALDYLNPAAIPVAPDGGSLTPEEQAEADTRQRLIAAFGVFEEQGIFSEINGPQKQRAEKLYKMMRTSFVIQS